MSNILLIDDDDSTRTAIRAMLKTVGHSVAEASSADAGLASYQQHRADVVIMDLLMPGKNGLDTIKEFISKDPQVKIIAISASGLDYLSWAEKHGAKSSLAKPFMREHLIKTVQQVIDQP